MIGNFIDMSEVAIYTAALNVANLWSFILKAVIDSVRPVIIGGFKDDNKRFETQIKKLYVFILFGGAIVAFFISLFSEQIIYILYGIDYISAASALKILCWSVILSYLCVAREIWLVLHNKQRYIKYFSFYGAIANVLLNALLIPFLGIVGAAISTVITQIIINFIMPSLFKETRKSHKLLIDAILFKNMK